MEINLAKMQDERTQRAQEGLADGSMAITSKPDHWVVQHGDKEPYKVELLDDGSCICSCWDFSRIRKSSLRCKHIEAVRLYSDKHTVTTQTNNNLFHKEVTMNENDNNYGLVKLYHPVAGGVQCTLPLPTVALTKDQAQAMFDSLNILLEVGFVPTQMGLEQGETKEAVTHLARRSKANTDNTSTPIVDVYCNGNFKVLGVYLNNTDDIVAFNAAFGLDLFKDIPLYDGDTSIERGKNADRDKKYVVPVSGVDAIYKLNPKWEGDDDKKHSKRMLVRWEPRAPKSSPAPVPINDTEVPPAPPLKHIDTEQTLKDLGFPPEAPKPVVPQPPAPTVRLYADGTAVSSNEAESRAFDAYVLKNKKVPASLQGLRDSVAA